MKRELGRKVVDDGPVEGVHLTLEQIVRMN